MHSYAGSAVCVHGLGTHVKQSLPVKDNIEEVTHILSFALLHVIPGFMCSFAGVMELPVQIPSSGASS